MTPGLQESREAFFSAARWFLSTVDRVRDRWEEPGLGEWDVRALVGHTSRSFLTIETYLQQPAAGVDVGSTGDYYRATRAMAVGPAVTERGRAAGAALGPDPVTELAAIAGRVLPL